ncbi:MAG: TolC family outer membrane protein [Caulobacterales bacterium]
MRFFVTAALIALVGPMAAADAQELSDALASAYRHNPTLEGARAQARASDEGLVQARAGYLPRVDVVGSAGVRSNESSLSGTSLGRQDLDPESLSVQASQSLYTGGRRGAQSRIARNQVELARARLRGVEQQVLLEVITTYVDVLRDEEVVRIRANNVAVLERQQQAAQSRFEVGLSTLTDVAQARARLAGAVAGLAGARAVLEGSRARYVEVVGEVPEGLSAPPVAASVPADLDAALNAALSSSPQVLSSEAAVRIAEAQVRVDVSTLLPQVSVVGSASRNRETSSPNVETDSMSAVAQVSVPLFQGGLAASRVRQSRINAERARADLEVARRQAISDVTSAWSALLAARQATEASKQQVEANTLAFEGVELEQEAGERTTLDVLDAEQELLDARLALVRTERDTYVAAHALLAAAGQLDAASLGVNVPLYDPNDHERASMRRFFSLSPAE